jgi:hypothetical protein
MYIGYVPIFETLLLANQSNPVDIQVYPTIQWDGAYVAYNLMPVHSSVGKLPS